MTELTPKQLQEWKEALAKSGIKYETDEEYKEALHNLAGYFDILIQIDLKQKNNPNKH